MRIRAVHSLQNRLGGFDSRALAQDKTEQERDAKMEDAGCDVCAGIELLKDGEEKEIGHGDYFLLSARNNRGRLLIVSVGEETVLAELNYCPKCGRKLKGAKTVIDKFTWSDLKPGMLVELRNGLRRIVLPLKDGGVYLSGVFNNIKDDYHEDLYYKGNPVPDEEHDMDIIDVYGLPEDVDERDQFSTHSRELLWTSLREGRVFDFFKFVHWALANPEEFASDNYVVKVKDMISLHGKVAVFVPGENLATLHYSLISPVVAIRREWTVASKDELEDAGEECEK